MVTLVNAGTSYTCWSGARYACQGDPKDDNQPYSEADRRPLDAARGWESAVVGLVVTAAVVGP